MTSFIILGPDQNTIPALTPILTKLWKVNKFGDAPQCYSARVEWVSDGQAEYNFTEILRENVNYTTPPSGQPATFQAAWERFLLGWEEILRDGKRMLDVGFDGNPLGRCGGIGTLGLTLDNAELVFLREPRLLPRADDPDTMTLLTEFSLRRTH